MSSVARRRREAQAASSADSSVSNNREEEDQAPHDGRRMVAPPAWWGERSGGFGWPKMSVEEVEREIERVGAEEVELEREDLAVDAEEASPVPSGRRTSSDDAGLRTSFEGRPGGLSRSSRRRRRRRSRSRSASVRSDSPPEEAHFAPNPLVTGALVMNMPSSSRDGGPPREPVVAIPGFPRDGGPPREPVGAIPGSSRDGRPPREPGVAIPGASRDGGPPHGQAASAAREERRQAVRELRRRQESREAVRELARRMSPGSAMEAAWQESREAVRELARRRQEAGMEAFSARIREMREANTVVLPDDSYSDRVIRLSVAPD